MQKPDSSANALLGVDAELTEEDLREIEAAATEEAVAEEQLAATLPPPDQEPKGSSETGKVFVSRPVTGVAAFPDFSA